MPQKLFKRHFLATNMQQVAILGIFVAHFGTFKDKFVL